MRAGMEPGPSEKNLKIKCMSTKKKKSGLDSSGSLRELFLLLKKL